jgi:hypothetical protein
VRAIADLTAEIEQTAYEIRVSPWACMGQVVLNSAAKKAAFRLAKADRELINKRRVIRRHSDRKVAANPWLSQEGRAAPGGADRHGLRLMVGGLVDGERKT